MAQRSTNPVITPEDLVVTFAGYKPVVKPCMVCREHEQSVHVRGGGEVCDWCAMGIPVEMLPKGWPL